VFYKHFSGFGFFCSHTESKPAHLPLPPTGALRGRKPLGNSLEESMARFFFIIMIMVVILSGCNSLVTPAPEIIKTPFPTITPLSSPTTTLLPPSTTPSPSQNIRGGQINIDCNNSLTDATAINAAIKSSAVGDEIVISGQCLINQTIRLIGDRSYRGTSMTGTILKQADGANLFALIANESFLDNVIWTGTPVSIRHIRLEGNSTNNTGAKTAGIILRAWLSVIEDVYIHDMSSDGLKLTNKSFNGTELTTSQVNGRISNNMIDESGRYGIYVEDSQNAVTDWFLTDNWIGRSGVDAIHLENAAGWVIERNHIYRVPQNAIYAHRIWNTSISDNLIEGFGETNQIGDWYGIYATVQGEAASTISNNRITNISGENNPSSNYRYILVTVNYETGMVSIIGNTIRGAHLPSEIGLYYSGGGSHKLIVTSFGNLVEDINSERVISGSVILSNGY
jgi:hypothetical protein